MVLRIPKWGACFQRYSEHEPLFQMSTALLKFQPSKGSPPQAAIFAAALDACPQALAIAEDGKVIYRNHSFAESSGSADELPRPNFRADSDWQETSFAVDGHSFQLLTLRPSVPVSDSQHLALIGAT